MSGDRANCFFPIFIGPKWNIVFKMGSCYIHLLVAFYFVTLATAGIMGDACDWTGSGLTTGTSRGVTPVYLRCRAGRLTWLYPRGALRVILRLHNSEKDFKVCLKILSPTGHDPKDDEELDLFADRHRQVLDFRERALLTNEVDGKRRSKKDIEFPARLYLEGKRSLVPLYASDDGGGRSVRCFQSKGGRAAIYVEASGNDAHSGPRRAARLLYDLQPLPTRAYDPAEEECRPCTAKEMAHAFCTSDLVAKGVIVGVQQRPELDTTELTIQVTKLIRYTSNDGRTFQADATPESESSSPRSRNVTFFRSPDEDIFDELGDPDGGPWFGKIHAGAHCGVAGGAGEFLVSARRRLGALSLACSPRTSEWAEVAKALNADGTAHCLLSP